MKPISATLLLAFLFLICSVNAQPTGCTSGVISLTPGPSGPYNMSILQFGAIPNDNCSDQAAFEAAARFFNIALAKDASGNCSSESGILEIPAGDYIVGRQVPGAVLREGIDPLGFENICNLTILGDIEGNTKIRMEDCMYFGSFTENSGTMERVLPSGSCPVFTAPQYTCSVGNMISFFSSDKLTIRDINLWGNSDNLLIGGRIGDHGIQQNADGFTFEVCSDILIENCTAKKMGRDGIQVLNRSLIDCTNDYYPVRITISNSEFDWNGRNGFSIAGGSHYYIDHCSFNHNGQGRVTSQTLSGVDIELHNFCGGAGLPKMISDVNFTNCEFKFNEATGVLNNYDNLKPLPRKAVEDINFENCLFVASEKGFAIKTSAKKTTFTSSKIHGATLGFYPVDLAYDPNDLDNRTVFQDCVFYDTYNGMNIGGGGFLIHGPHLTVNSMGDTWPGASGLLMRSCYIHTGCAKAAFYLLSTWDPAGLAVFEDVHWMYSGGPSVLRWQSNVWQNVLFEDFTIHLPVGSPISGPNTGLGGITSCFGTVPCPNPANCFTWNWNCNPNFSGSYHGEINYIFNDPAVPLLTPCSNSVTYQECPPTMPPLNHSLGGSCTNVVTEPIGSCPPELIPCDPELDPEPVASKSAATRAKLLLRPNPASSSITVDLPSEFVDRVVRIEVVDLAGITHLSSEFKNCPLQVNLIVTELPEGMYLLSAETEDGYSAVNRLFITR